MSDEAPVSGVDFILPLSGRAAVWSEEGPQAEAAGTAGAARGLALRRIDHLDRVRLPLRTAALYEPAEQLKIAERDVLVLRRDPGRFLNSVSAVSIAVLPGPDGNGAVAPVAAPNGRDAVTVYFGTSAADRERRCEEICSRRQVARCVNLGLRLGG